MTNKAIIFYGKPGSGKGTQANLIADKFDAVHLDTGRHIESVIRDPKNQNDPIIQKQKELFDSGALCDPEWVLEISKKKVREVHESDSSIVFSGSPRTMFEAEGLVPLLEELYGKDRIDVFVLDISDETAIKRNSSRWVCSFCGAPLLVEYYPKLDSDPKYCPRCGGDLRKRSLDNPETMKVRLKEYEERTFPIFAFMEQRGIDLIHVNGEPRPSEIFPRIYVHLTEEHK